MTPADIGAYPNGIKGVVDCNTLTDGVWTISDSAKNVPGAFACTLFHKDWNAGFASQIAFGANRNVYYRVKTNGSWLAWQEMYSTLRYPSPSKIGAAESNHNHAGSSINPSSIEINPGTSTSHGGYIDFHYKGSTGDYTTRILESASGKLDIDAPSGVYVSHPPVGTDALRNIQAGTTDLAAGSTSLATGAIYFVYE